MMMTMTMISAIKVMMNKAILIPQHSSLQDNLSEHIDVDGDGEDDDDDDDDDDDEVEKEKNKREVYWNGTWEI